MSKLSSEEIYKFNLSQENPMFHGLTCMGFNGCKRSDQEKDGLLIATEDGIICPCGEYTQNYPDSLGPTFEESKQMLPDNLRSIMEEQENKRNSPYCKECDGCGEELCCSPLICKMSENGDYCKSYLRDLKYTYDLHDRLLEKIQGKKYIKEIDEIIESICDEIYDKYYNNEDED